MGQRVFRLSEYPAHLGLGAKVSLQERFTGAMDWYERYGARTVADGAEGRLVSLHTFSEPWESWEMHPSGDELVVSMPGGGSLLLEQRAVAVKGDMFEDMFGMKVRLEGN